MLPYKKKAVLCGTAVFVLGLISCTKDDPSEKAKAQAWAMQEPIIRQVSGDEIKYTEVNQTQSVTYSVDDILVFTGPVSDVALMIQTVCSRNEERLTYSRRTQLREEMKLLEFLPREVLYSPDALHLNDVSCSLELTASNSNGSVHYFPALHIKMNEESQNELALIRGMRKIEGKYNQLPRIQIAKFNEVFLPQLSPGTHYFLQCENLIATSGERDVRVLADLEVQVDFSDQVASEVCRLFLMFETTGVWAVSPFFIIEFLSLDGMLSTNHTPSPSKATNSFATGYSLETISLSRHTVRNDFDQPLYLRVAKTWPLFMKIKLLKAVKTEVRDTAFTSIGGHVSIKQDSKYWLVKLNPGQQMSVSVEIRPHVQCFNAIIEVLAHLEQPLRIEALEADFEKNIATWEASPRYFSKIPGNFSDNKNYQPRIPTHYKFEPNACRVSR